LDPWASGLVLLCTGKYTKKINELMGQDKEYKGSLVLGKTTASIDLETLLEDAGDYNVKDAWTIGEFVNSYRTLQQ